MNDPNYSDDLVEGEWSMRELGTIGMLCLAGQCHPDILDDPEYLRKVTGLPPERHAKALGLVRRVIERLKDGGSQLRPWPAKPVQEADDHKSHGEVFGGNHGDLTP